MLGLKPLTELIEGGGDEVADGLNPAKLVGAKGIVGAGLDSAVEDEIELPKTNALLAPVDTSGDGAVGLESPDVKLGVELAVAVAFLTSSSYSFLIFSLTDLYCPRIWAKSVNGSDSTAVVMAFIKDMFSPRRAQ